MPNGTYTVAIGYGDTALNTLNVIRANGTQVVNAWNSHQNRSSSATVTVSNGQLRLSFGDGTSTKTAINWITATPVGGTTAPTTIPAHTPTTTTVQPTTTATTTAAPTTTTTSTQATNPPARSADRGTKLSAGDRLYPGEYLRNGNYRALMQGDGRLVTYDTTSNPWRATWFTEDHPDGSYADMQADGNFVLYRPNGTRAADGFHTGSAGHHGAALVLGNDGWLDLNYHGTTLWTTGPRQGGDTLRPGEVLNPGGYLANGDYRLVMQSDGNLVTYNTSTHPWTAVWATGAKGPNTYALMQSDGNFVVDRVGVGLQFTTRTSSASGALLELTDGGSVRVSNNGRPVWWSTNGSLSGGGASFSPLPADVADHIDEGLAQPNSSRPWTQHDPVVACYDHGIRVGSSDYIEACLSAAKIWMLAQTDAYNFFVNLAFAAGPEIDPRAYYDQFIACTNLALDCLSSLAAAVDLFHCFRDAYTDYRGVFWDGIVPNGASACLGTVFGVIWGWYGFQGGADRDVFSVRASWRAFRGDIDAELDNATRHIQETLDRQRQTDATRIAYDDRWSQELELRRSHWDLSEIARGQAIRDHLGNSLYRAWSPSTHQYFHYQTGDVFVRIGSFATTTDYALFTARLAIRNMDKKRPVVDGENARLRYDVRVRPGRIAAYTSLVAYGRNYGVQVTVNEWG